MSEDDVLLDQLDTMIEQLQTENERLRERNNVLEIAHRQTHKTLDEAYAEIERLRAANGQLHRWKALDKPLTAAMSIAQTEIKRLRTENDWLKEQLRLYGSRPSTPEAKP